MEPKIGSVVELNKDIERKYSNLSSPLSKKYPKGTRGIYLGKYAGILIEKHKVLLDYTLGLEQELIDLTDLKGWEES